METLTAYKTQHEGTNLPNDIRRFLLVRERDMTGISGTGIVAEGAKFRSGMCVLQWRREPYTVGIFQSLSDLIAVHGHEGATQVEFIDQE
jgi:hypothetical protein